MAEATLYAVLSRQTGRQWLISVTGYFCSRRRVRAPRQECGMLPLWRTSFTQSRRAPGRSVVPCVSSA
eukprot:707849-Rhodomonas_salina.1